MSRFDSRGFRLGYATFAIFTGFAGDFWRDLLTWYGYAVMVVLVSAGAVVLLKRNGRHLRAAQLPISLIAFGALAFLSLIWSDYRPFTLVADLVFVATAGTATAIAITVSWAELLRVLGRVFRLILALSFVFEFIVSAFIRHPIYPVWVVPDDPAHPAALLYWSRNLLFEAGKIQGIVGNSSLLAMAALLGLIVFVLQLATKSVGRASGAFWIVIALITIGLTRSATIAVGLAAVIVVAAAVIFVRRVSRPSYRAAAFAIVAVIAVLVISFRGPIVSVLGKSSTFTGRAGIWQKVLELSHERPTLGWGWISYWVPWIKPFDGLINRGGVQVQHAHDAWLDVLLQLGIVGVVVFAALVLSTLVRSWLLATDRVITRPRTRGTYSWVALLPLLFFVAQLIQSIVESRMLLEGGLLMLLLWAVKTKLEPAAVDVRTDAAAIPLRASA